MSTNRTSATPPSTTRNAADVALAFYRQQNRPLEEKRREAERAVQQAQAQVRRLLEVSQRTWAPKVQALFNDAWRRAFNRALRVHLWDNLAAHLRPLLLGLLFALALRYMLDATWLRGLAAVVLGIGALRSLAGALKALVRPPEGASRVQAAQTPGAQMALYLFVLASFWDLWALLGVVAVLMARFSSVLGSVLRRFGSDLENPDYLRLFRACATPVEVGKVQVFTVEALTRDVVPVTTLTGSRGRVGPFDNFLRIQAGGVFVAAYGPEHGVIATPALRHSPEMEFLFPYLDRALQRHQEVWEQWLSQGREIKRAQDQLEEKLAEAKAATQVEDGAVQRARALDGVYLPESIVVDLLSDLELFRTGNPAALAGVLLRGPRGVGKTEFASRMAAVAGCHFKAISAEDLIAGNVGGTEENVRSLFDELGQQGPTVLFFDECEGGLPDRRSTEATEFAKVVTRVFLNRWPGGKGSPRVFLVGATNHPEAIDTAILSRFGRVVEVPLPDAAGREGILRTQFRSFGVECSVTPEMVAATAGFAGRDLKTLAQQMVSRYQAMERMGTAPRWESLFEELVADKRQGVSTSVNPNSTWESLILDEEIKERLQGMAADLHDVDILRAQGISVPKAVLFEGEPGVGKTEAARVIANTSGLAFYAPGPSELIGSHIGATPRVVRSVFERARDMSPAILFIDEADKALPRPEFGNQFTEDAVSTFLQEMDGVRQDDRHLFIIFSTNYPERLPENLLSRMEERIVFPLPSQWARAEILRVRLREKPLGFEISEAFLQRLAEQTEGFSGRALGDLVKEAEGRAKRRAREEGNIQDIQLLPEDFAVSPRRRARPQPSEAEAGPEVPELPQGWPRTRLGHLPRPDAPPST